MGRFAEGIDLRGHEELSPELIGMMEKTAKDLGNDTLAKIMFDVPDYHASPREAAETARNAGVGHLLYYHVVPPIIVTGILASTKINLGPHLSKIGPAINCVKL